MAYVVDDDESIRTLWQWLMGRTASRCRPSRAPASSSPTGAATRAAVLDVRLPGMSGPELRDYLRREGIEIPIVFVTAHGDVPTAVNALKGGAVDFIQKPFDYREAWRRCAGRSSATRRPASGARRAQLAERLAALTERERGVLQRVIEGKANKVIAAELDISVKTVEAHRSKVMEKMAADSVAELVQRIIGFSLMETPGGGG